MSTPILNPPQSAILGMHKIERRPVVGAATRIEIRPMMYLALSYDHRIIDGREAVTFLVRVKECIEDPAAPAVRHLRAMAEQLRRRRHRRRAGRLCRGDPRGAARHERRLRRASAQRSAAPASISAASRRRRCCNPRRNSPRRGTRSPCTASRSATSSSISPAMMARKDKVVGDNTRGVEFLFRKNKVDWLKGARAHRRARPGRGRRRAARVEAGAIVIATGSDSDAAAGRRDRREDASSPRPARWR